MPRKKKVKEADALEPAVIAEPEKPQEPPKTPDPDRNGPPEPSHEQPNPEATGHRHQATWAETVRPWKGPGNTGVELVTFTSPDAIGLKFPDDYHATPGEKIEMTREAGLKWFQALKAYIAHKPPLSEPDARRAQWEKVDELHQRFHERRQQEAAEGMAR